MEVVKAAYVAWNAGDMDAFRELHHPDVILFRRRFAPGFERTNLGADKAQAMLFSWLAPGVFAIVAGAFLATGSYVFGAIFSGLAVAARWFDQISVHHGES